MESGVSLAEMIREYCGRWDIEKIERSTQWIAVRRDPGDGCIRIIEGHDLGSLRFHMAKAERDEPEGRVPDGTL